MDVIFGNSSRNGLESSYFEITGSKEAKKILGTLNSELEQQFPLKETYAEQEITNKEIERQLTELKVNRDKAKSKKTRVTLGARVVVYSSFLDQMKKYSEELKSLEKKAADELIAAEKEVARAAEEERQRLAREKELADAKAAAEKELADAKLVELKTTTETEAAVKSVKDAVKDDGIIGSIKKGLSAITGGATQEAAGGEAAQPAKKNKTLLYIGVAAAVVVGFLILRKKK